MTSLIATPVLYMKNKSLQFLEGPVFTSSVRGT